ncbi:MAG: transglutaminase N-terminal domain-containing protein, partial [Beutenbergiaceae bacterium]
MSAAPSVRHYRLTHRTRYSYPQEVTASYGRALVLPRPGGGQQVHASKLEITPEAAHTTEHRDYHGNTSSYFHVTQPHSNLQVQSSSVLSVTRRPADPERLPKVAWEVAAQAVRTVFDGNSGGPSGAGALAIAEARLPSASVEIDESVRTYAAASFGPGRTVVEVVQDLSRRIFADFTYRSGSTTVDTTLPQVLEHRMGVCQDFAHLLIGCVRSMGLSARYISGYIETH